MADDEPDAAEAPKSDSNIAIKVAALSTIAALLGSTIGVSGSVYVAKQQLNQQLVFRLEERKREAYLNYLTAASDLHSRLNARNERQTQAASQAVVQQGMNPTATPSPTLTKQEVKDAAQEIKDLTTSQSGLTQPLAQVAIYGSKQVMSDARQLEFELRMATSLVTVEAAGGTDEDKPGDAEQAFALQLKKVQDSYDAYVASVRTELGVLDKK